MSVDPTAEDLEVITALADELIRRVPALESLATLGRETSRIQAVGTHIEFDLADVVPLETVERAYVGYALRRCGGNKTHVAKALGIDPSTLYRKLARWGL